MYHFSKTGEDRIGKIHSPIVSGPDPTFQVQPTTVLISNLHSPEHACSRGEHGQDPDWISSKILAIFWIRIGFGFIFEKNGSGCWFDFSKEIFLRVVQDGGSVFFAMFFILSV